MRATRRFAGFSFVTRLVAASAFTALALTACGGGGYGGGMSGGMTCGGAYGGACPNPSVALTAPAAGATVSGTVVLMATASAAAMSGLTVMRVDFFVDAIGGGMATT
jgi:hypothetical protein